MGALKEEDYLAVREVLKEEIRRKKKMMMMSHQDCSKSSMENKQTSEKAITSEKMQRIKEARDYSFLFTDGPLPASVVRPKSLPVNDNEKTNKSLSTLNKNKVVEQIEEMMMMMKKKNPPVLIQTTKESTVPGLKKIALREPNTKIKPQQSMAAVACKPSQEKNPSGTKKIAVEEPKIKIMPKQTAAVVASKAKIAVQETKIKIKAPPSMAVASKANQEKGPAEMKKIAVQETKIKIKQAPSVAVVASKANQEKSPGVMKKQNMALTKKKRPAKEVYGEENCYDYEETQKALSMIRKMFNTRRFIGRDDSDNRHMETSFDQVLKEESQSARLATKEDQEQLRLILEEEQRERDGRKAKKAKRV